MKVLVLNCGSSSVKFQLVETEAESAAAGRDRALAQGARPRVFVVPTNEEILIARDTLRIVAGLPPA